MQKAPPDRSGGACCLVIGPLGEAYSSSPEVSAASSSSCSTTGAAAPIAAAIGLEVIAMIKSGLYQKNALERGEQVRKCLQQLHAQFPGVLESFRQVGLWIGLDLNPQVVSGREFCELMQTQGVLLKDAHDSVVRVSPPLSATTEDINFLCGALRTVVESLS